MRADPGRKQSAKREAGDGDAFAEFARDADVGVGRGIELVRAQTRERRRKPVGMTVAWKPRWKSWRA
jgi:hypothetical protein